MVMGGLASLTHVRTEGPAPQSEDPGTVCAVPPSGLEIFIADPRMIDRWARDAQPGDELPWARIEHLPPRSLARETANKLEAAHKVTLMQRREPSGLVLHWMRRKAKVRSSAPASAPRKGARLHPEAELVERYLRQVAKAKGVCPKYETIARMCGLRSADRARLRDRELRKAKRISSEIIDMQSGLRVVSFPDGMMTARPGEAAQ